MEGTGPSTSSMSVGRPSAEDIRQRALAAKDERSELVAIEEWGVEVEVRSMTGKERAAVLRRYLSEDGEIDYERLNPELIVATVCAPGTEDRVFSGADIEALNERNAGVLERLAGVALRLSGLDRAARARAGKGSSESPNGSSTST